MIVSGVGWLAENGTACQALLAVRAPLVWANPAGMLESVEQEEPENEESRWSWLWFVVWDNAGRA